MDKKNNSTIKMKIAIGIVIGIEGNPDVNEIKAGIPSDLLLKASPPQAPVHRERWVNLPGKDLIHF